MGQSKVAIIGSGFAGLAAACSLAKEGALVTIWEKNATTGGRARSFRHGNFLFDMGPSWYWMPEVFDDFFAAFGKKTSDYYSLKRLDPSYRVVFKDGAVDIPANILELQKVLDGIEPGAGDQLIAFLKEAKVKYDTGMGEFVWKPSLSIMEFVDVRLLKESLRLDLLTPMSAHLRKYFKHPKILQLLEFPVLFLGAKPSKTPALYSMMNYADISLGTWYPDGGMFRIAEAMTALAKELGVAIHTSSEVTSIVAKDNKATGLIVNGTEHSYDAVIGAGDYHHIEQHLLEPKYRTYTEKYWDRRVMSPSSLLFYLGINRKIEGLLHHNLFFDESFERHAEFIYDTPGWPDKPLFYVCAPSKSDPSVAPEGMENLFILIPAAPNLKSDEVLRNHYLQMVIARILKQTGVDITDHIVYQRSFAHEEFISEYHSYKGNAYGLANTLTQTAFLKPRMKSRKLNNLFYTGQLTVPGPGVPPSIISGRVVAKSVVQHLRIQQPVAS
jgi:phytoene desaturase